MFQNQIERKGVIRRPKLAVIYKQASAIFVCPNGTYNACDDDDNDDIFLCLPNLLYYGLLY